MRIADLFLRMVADFSGFEKDVVKGAQSAGDKAGLAVGERISGGFSRGARDISRTLGTVGKELTGVGRGMLTNLTLPLLAAGGAATKFALDFDTTLRQVVGLTDVTQDQIDGIREKILALGPAVGKGPQELAEAFYFVASAGFKADEAMVVLETSARAAAAGLGDTQTIAQVLGGVINAYGRENITAATAADILTEAVAQGTAEASGLASVIGNVVPGAAALGVSFDQVTAAMAGMTLSGVGVEESATSLIQIFNSLLKPTVQAEEAMKGLGLSGAELRRQLREEGLLATLRTLEERFAGNETASAAVFGNIRALRGVTALLTLDSDQLSQVFAKVADSTGRMGQAYDETEGPQRDLARSMAELQAVAIEFGTDILPTVVDVLKQIAGGAKELGKWWKSLDEDTRKQVVQWLAWLAVAGPVLIVIGKLATGLSGLFKLIGFLGGAKGIPALITNLKNLGLKGAIVVTVIAAIALALNETTDDVSYFFDELTKGKDATKTLKKLQEITGDMAKSQALRAWGVSVEEFVMVVERAEGDVDDAFNAIKDASGDVAEALNELSGGSTTMSQAWAEAWREVKVTTEAGGRLVAATAEAIPTEVAAVLEDGQFVVGPAAEEMVDPIQEALKKAVTDAATRAQEIINALASTLATGPEQIKDEMEALVEALTNPYTEVERLVDLEGALAADAFADALASGDPRLEADAFQRMQALLGQYELIAPGALAAGELVNPALQAGIDSNLAAALTWVQANVTGPYTNYFDLADVLEGMGYNGLAAYTRGIELARVRELQLLKAPLANTVNSLLPTDLFKEGYRGGKSYADGWEASIPYLKTKIVKVGAVPKNLLETFSEPKDPASPLRGITRWGYNAVLTIAKSMLRGIPEMVRAASAVGYAMAVQPGMMTPAWAGAVPTAAGLYGGTSTPPVTHGGDVTNIYLTVEGQKPVVSTAVEIAEQAARVGRFRG